MVWRRRVIFTRSSRSWMARAGAGAAGAAGATAVLAGAGDGPGVQAGFRDDALHAGGQRLVVGDRGGRSRRGLGRFKLGCGRGFRLGGFGFRRSGSAAGGHDAEQGAGDDRVAVIGGDAFQHAVGGAGDLEADLVGFQLNDDLVLLHSLARLLLPAGDRRFADGFTEGGGHDVGHRSLLVCLFGLSPGGAGIGLVRRKRP
jgi:hypothetical protein